MSTKHVAAVESSSFWVDLETRPRNVTSIISYTRVAYTVVTIVRCTVCKLNNDIIMYLLGMSYRWSACSIEIPPTRECIQDFYQGGGEGKLNINNKILMNSLFKFVYQYWPNTFETTQYVAYAMDLWQSILKCRLVKNKYKNCKVTSIRGRGQLPLLSSPWLCPCAHMLSTATVLAV